MDKIDKLYKKALQGARNRHSRELLAQGAKFIEVWADVMRCCYKSGIDIPEEREHIERLLLDVCSKCGYEDVAYRFIAWYFDEDNDATFVIRDYGDGDVEYG